MTDPISDMLTRIRNALALKKPEVILPFSQMKFSIAKILEKEKFVERVEKRKKKFLELKIKLAYSREGEPAIQNLKRVSKPGRRLYVTRNQLPRVLNGLGLAIISTPHGLMTNKEARRKKLGGEVVCEIW